MTNNQSSIIVRKARLKDVPLMMPLLEEYARQAEILPRDEDDVYRSIREWVVAEAPNTRIVGVGSLLVMWHDLAEIRSLVVYPDYHGQGVGRRLVELLLSDAHTLKLGRVFALTRKPAFFMKLGFELTHIERLPRKVKRDCVFCPKFHACDEVAVITRLKAAPAVDATPAPATVENGVASSNIIPLLSS